MRELFGVRHIQDASKVMLVTSSFASRDALREFARTIPHQLTVMNYTALVAVCRNYASHPLACSSRRRAF